MKLTLHLNSLRTLCELGVSALSFRLEPDAHCQKTVAEAAEVKQRVDCYWQESETRIREKLKRCKCPFQIGDDIVAALGDVIAEYVRAVATFVATTRVGVLPAPLRSHTSPLISAFPDWAQPGYWNLREPKG